MHEPPAAPHCVVIVAPDTLTVAHGSSDNRNVRSSEAAFSTALPIVKFVEISMGVEVDAACLALHGRLVDCVGGLLVRQRVLVAAQHQAPTAPTARNGTANDSILYAWLLSAGYVWVPRASTSL